MMLYRRNCIDSSGRFTRTVRAALLRLFLFSILFSVPSVFATDDQELELYIGNNETAAILGNTATVYKKAGEEFGWFAKWYWTSTSDEYNGDLYLEGVSEDPIYDSGSGWRDDSGTVTIPTTPTPMETGEEKVVKAKVGKGASPTEWIETEVTNLTVVSFKIDTPEKFPVYVAVNDSLSLGSIFEPASITTESYAWTKESGPGTGIVTFTPNNATTAAQTSFSADTAGEYDVKCECEIDGYLFEDTAGKINVVLSGSLVLEDEHTGNSEVDQANGGPAPPDTLYAGTADDDGEGDVKFWLVDPTSGVDFDWEITPGEGLEGDLLSTDDPPYEDTCHDLEAGKEYTLTVTTASDTSYERKIEFVIPKVEITDEDDDVITTTEDVSVGSKMHLKTKIEPSGLTADDYKWTVPEKLVEGYDKTDLGNGRSKAEVDEMEKEDFENSTITFYWVDGADGRDVSVSCTIEGVPCTDTVQFNVKRPTTSNSDIISDGDIEVTGLKLHYGSLTIPGFGWDIIVHGVGFPGEIKFTQVMAADVQRTKIDNSTESWKVPEWWLDVADPYAGKQESLTPGFGSQVLSMVDAPAIPLPADYKKMDNKFEKFKTYLMFKPDGTDSIWVPLKIVLWAWDAIAESTDEGTTWTETSEGEFPSPGPPIDFPTIQFPEWDDTKTNVPEHPTWQAD